MDEYIRKRAAIDALKAVAGVGNRILGRIEDLPAEDVVQVVRCGDCEFTDVTDGDVIWCTGNGFPQRMVPPDGFCSNAKRRGRNG